MSAVLPEPVIIGRATLYLGDCRDILPTLGKVDAVVTDPPYGIAFATNRGFSSWDKTEIANDRDTSARDAVLSLAPASSALVFGSWKMPKPEGTHTVLIWDKGDAAGMGDLSIPWKPNHEEIYVIGKGFKGHRGPAVLRHTVLTWESKGRCHPNEKPIALMRDLVRKVAGETILDPFMGSGSTGVAALREGKRFVGIEIDPMHFETACRRIRETSGDDAGPLFGEAA
jgi:DNA modification methylase